jgi:hypothetical protein
MKLQLWMKHRDLKAAIRTAMLALLDEAAPGNARH